ncbi:DUF7344 domain-containing protein [Halostella salina]|uniref:DUF7344 domain-containing protein n=1 Tax=Halostella salina TaxID=1547897 RepID=UPI000EF7BE33|nr:hypothetical protein [Halostella salina]
MQEAGDPRHTTAVVRDLQRSEDGSATEDRDALFDALSHRYRRFAIDALDSCDGSLALADLAAEVAERDAESDASVPDHVRRVEVELYHVHVPKLAAIGVVRFDRDRNVVGLTGRSQ